MIARWQTGGWQLQQRAQSTSTNDNIVEPKDSLRDFFRNLGEYESLASVDSKVIVVSLPSGEG